MLHEFLKTNRALILERASKRFLRNTIPVPTADELSLGLPMVFDQLTELLDRVHIDVDADEALIAEAATKYGSELFRLGFSIAQVVRGYGTICEETTRLADELAASITPREFHVLNRSLDIAIAAAATQFEVERLRTASAKEVMDLGFLAHELRNSLTTAVTAAALVRKGTVAMTGSTSMLLDRSLTRMRDLIDRSLAEVRLRAPADAVLEPVPLFSLVDEVVATLVADAERRQERVVVAVDATLAVKADRHLLTSALSNLLQNAVKYTRGGGTITIRASAELGRAFIEIEDECGGLPPGTADKLFAPYVQRSGDRSGLGLGLAIVQRAVHAQGGGVKVTDLPGRGCVFTIDLPEEHLAGFGPSTLLQ